MGWMVGWWPPKSPSVDIPWDSVQVQGPDKGTTDENSVQSKERVGGGKSLSTAALWGRLKKSDAKPSPDPGKGWKRGSVVNSWWVQLVPPMLPLRTKDVSPPPASVQAYISAPTAAICRPLPGSVRVAFRLYTIVLWHQSSDHLCLTLCALSGLAPRAVHTATLSESHGFSGSDVSVVTTCVNGICKAPEAIPADPSLHRQSCRPSFASLPLRHAIALLQNHSQSPCHKAFVDQTSTSHLAPPISCASCVA